jgi:hypothetical protein
MSVNVFVNELLPSDSGMALAQLFPSGGATVGMRVGRLVGGGVLMVMFP